MDNPFCEPFQKVAKAIERKQNYETRQIKDMFHHEEAAVDMQAVVKLTEKARKPMADAIKSSFKPVEHTIYITAM